MKLYFLTVDQSVREMTKIGNRLLGLLPGTSMALRIVNKLREDVLEMNKMLPAIELVSRPGIKERHWNEIFELLEIPSIDIVFSNFCNRGF